MNTWKKLAELLHYGTPILRALTSFRDRYRDRGHPLEKLFSDVLQRMNSGASFDEAIQPWIPQTEVMLIRGGIKGNRLPKSLRECASIITARRQIMKSVKSAVAMPVVLILLLCILFFIVAGYLMPRVAMVQDTTEFTGLGGLLFSVSTFVASGGGIFLLIGIVAVVVGIVFSMPNWTGRYRVFADSIPPWSIYRLVVGSMWLYTMSTLLKANVSLNLILSDSLQSGFLQPWLRERVELLNRLFQSDVNFGSLLIKLNMNFPDKELLEELAVYATLPNFSDQFHEIATDWLTEGVEKVERQSAILNNVLFIIIGAVMSLIVLSIGAINDQITGAF
jgi:type II secretory pathway component PulF